MLRKTRKKARALLGNLYSSPFYFIRKDNQVTVYSKFYTKSRKVSLNHLLSSTLPGKITDPDIRDTYLKSVGNCLAENDIVNAIDCAHDLYNTFLQENPKEKVPWKVKLAEYVQKQKQRITFPTWSLKKSQPLQNAKVQTVEKELKKNTKSTVETMRGIVSTGRAEFDAQFREILRCNTIPVAA